MYDLIARGERCDVNFNFWDSCRSARRVKCSLREIEFSAILPPAHDHHTDFSVSPVQLSIQQPAPGATVI